METTMTIARLMNRTVMIPILCLRGIPTCLFFVFCFFLLMLYKVYIHYTPQPEPMTK